MRLDEHNGTVTIICGCFTCMGADAACTYNNVGHDSKVQTLLYLFTCDEAVESTMKYKNNGLNHKGENMFEAEGKSAEASSDFSRETIVVPGGIWRLPQDGGHGWRATSTS